jgi:glycine/sarcosine N-methyltransferase
MQTEQSDQERFYNSIAEFYSLIFPFNPLQLSFVEGDLVSVEGKRILDAGCGSGELSFALAQKGATIEAIDLNEELLSQAQRHRSHDRIVFKNANMLHIAGIYGSSAFDAVICFGNTLVHLNDSAQIHDFFTSVHKVLKPSGKLFLQILHYDHIFRDKISELPCIENETLLFERRYHFKAGTFTLRFDTCLTIRKTGETLENETTLYGIGSEELKSLLLSAGFSDIDFYADFQKKPIGLTHLPLIGVARKAS